MKGYLIAILLLATTFSALSQRNYWQQRADYTMEIDFDVEKHQYKGKQSIKYTNNSPDTIRKAYYHLYFNAFQPGSMMDTRSQNIEDPDRRVANRITALTPEEIGFIKVSSLKQDGADVQFEHEGSILSARLASPLLPGESTVLDMTWDAQVPVQIRRSGRDNREGISYSMSQWFPKLAEYDEDGWHPNPYIGREFYGVWGDYDVKITIDPTYTIGGSGYLQNPNEIGHGYEDEGTKVKKHKGPITWHFIAPNVHDFMWGADPDYKHTKLQMEDGPMLHFFYQEGTETRDWELLPEQTAKAFALMNDLFGKYPYDQFSVVQGGDGGMEYPMSTLITGHRRLGSLLGVTVHEFIHSWYQGVLGTNESLYAWMDEGFTTYAGNIIMDNVFNGGKSANPHINSYRSYFRNSTSGNEQNLNLHADHYQNNRGYGVNAYSKGCVYLHQLSYVIGQKNLMVGMRRYFNEWKFKHPKPGDLLRIMEKISDMELDWYNEHFVNSTNTIDYAIDSVYESGGKTIITLNRNGQMMMPVDLYVEKTDGSAIVHYIPLKIMRGAKENEYLQADFRVEEDWAWTNPVYRLESDVPLSEIKNITIDLTGRLADINPANNRFTTDRVEKK